MKRKPIKDIPAASGSKNYNVMKHDMLAVFGTSETSATAALVHSCLWPLQPRSPKLKDISGLFFSLMKLKVRRQQIFVKFPTSLSVHLGRRHAHIQRSVRNQQRQRLQSIWALQDFCESCAAWVEGKHLPLTTVGNIDCSTFTYKQVREERFALSWDLAHYNRFQRLS